MTATRTAACLTLLVVACLTAGCSTRVRDKQGAPGFGDQLAATPAVAVTTVTVDPAVDGVFNEIDQADADDAFFGAFLAADRGLDVWHPETVRELVGAELLAEIAETYTSLSRVRPADILALAPTLEGCRFLALGRLTEDRVRTLDQSAVNNDPAVRAEGQADHGGTWTSIISVERRVRVTLEIFDLTSGESVWRSEATSSDKQLYEYDDATMSDPAAYLEERLAAADGPVYLSRHGDALKLPDLIGLVRKAYIKLAETLPRAGS